MDMGLLNFPVRLNTKIIYTLETNLNRLFKSAKKLTAISNAPDAQVIWHKAYFIQYEQIRLDDKFTMYLETSLMSKKVFRTGGQKTSHQKSFELGVGVQNYSVDLMAANRQFDWLEILLVYNKSGKHMTQETLPVQAICCLELRWLLYCTSNRLRKQSDLPRIT